jgi:hypothetical protein
VISITVLPVLYGGVRNINLFTDCPLSLVVTTLLSISLSLVESGYSLSLYPVERIWLRL